MFEGKSCSLFGAFTSSINLLLMPIALRVDKRVAEVRKTTREENSSVLLSLKLIVFIKYETEFSRRTFETGKRAYKKLCA